jgi:hypothetical protein
MVAFVGVERENAKRITFSHGTQLLGYNPKELKGMEFSAFIPTKFRPFHENGNVLLNIFKPTEESTVFKSTGDIHFETRSGMLV